MYIPWLKLFSARDKTVKVLSTREFINKERLGRIICRLYTAQNTETATFKNAVLKGVNVSDCDFSERLTEGAKKLTAYLCCPEEGSFIAWKKCKDDLLVKLLIPERAARTGKNSRSCRSSEAKVLEIIDSHGFSHNEAFSLYDESLVYRKGNSIYPKEPFDDSLFHNGSGIHFFLSRKEAEDYSPLPGKQI